MNDQGKNNDAERRGVLWDCFQNWFSVEFSYMGYSLCVKKPKIQSVKEKKSK